MTETRITSAELYEMFGETMPLEAAKLLMEAPATMTMGEVRRQLREMAGPHKRKTTVANILRNRLGRHLDARQLDVDFIYSSLADDIILALAIEPAKRADDGWIEWNGGICPVDRDTLVEVRLRGDTSGLRNIRDKARNIFWIGAGGGGDVSAYRVVKP